MRISSSYKLKLIAAAVALTGLVTIWSILLAVLHIRHSRVAQTDVGITLLVGLSFIYLASTLARGKRNAWLIATVLYVYLLARNIRHLDFDLSEIVHPLQAFILNVWLPGLVLVSLLINWRLYSVRSEIRSTATALRRAVVILLVAFLYGTVGFQLVDQKDFHQEIPLLTGAHYTIDQFGLTTNSRLDPQTKRATLFLDSLAVVSLGSLFYVAVSVFAPIRFRLSHSRRDFEDMRHLLEKYPYTSEDFFKLWPPGKAYYFNHDRSAALAYRTAGGVALVVGDPAGKKTAFENLIKMFQEYCRVNDWAPVFVHADKSNTELYERLGFELQKIGEEAIVDTGHFVKNVMASKDFRHINNKFERLKYQAEMLNPPHSPAVVARLREVSSDWLQAPGRAERGFMMGYFNDEYMQLCDVMVARDEAGTIAAFINQVPSFTSDEANFDFLRQTRGSPGNTNDYLMSQFIVYLHSQGVKRLNMGLAPLAGLEAGDEKNRGAIDAVMSLVYTTGNRFYSFKGLKRFKSKYEPRWEDRYIVYGGGWRGFGAAMNGLLRAMRLPRRH